MDLGNSPLIFNAPVLAIKSAELALADIILTNKVRFDIFFQA